MSDITIDVLSASTPAKRLSLPAEVFGASLNIPLIHQVVVAQLAAARQGTHATKTRGEVSGGGAKPWRQKGTGRARQGSRRAPQWTGGGTVFGPQPRSYAQRTPKKMVAAALRSALSDRVADGRFFVVDALVEGDQPSTKQALKSLAVIGSYRTALVVLHRDEDLAWLSLRNVPNVHAIAVDQVNVYDVVSNQAVVFTKPALDEFVARFGLAVDETDIAAEKPKTDKPKTVKKVEAPTTLEADELQVPPAKPAKTAKAIKAEPAAPAEPVAEPAAPAETTAKDYGAGSYRGSTPPDGYDIKGNEDSMLFHTPESPWYKRTIAEVWFNSPEAALAAGFTDVLEGKTDKQEGTK